MFSVYRTPRIGLVEFQRNAPHDTPTVPSAQQRSLSSSLRRWKCKRDSNSQITMEFLLSTEPQSRSNPGGPRSGLDAKLDPQWATFRESATELGGRGRHLMVWTFRVTSARLVLLAALIRPSTVRLKNDVAVRGSGVTQEEIGDERNQYTTAVLDGSKIDIAVCW